MATSKRYAVTEQAQEIVAASTPSEGWDEHGYVFFLIEDHETAVTAYELVGLIDAYNAENDAGEPVEAHKVQSSLDWLVEQGMLEVVT
jgi:hypothetical protein